MLIAVLDWFSRYVVSWRLSNTLDTGFYVEALHAALDSVFVERLWRTLKHEEIYLRGDDGAAALARGLGRYIDFYNEEEPHTAP